MWTVSLAEAFIHLFQNAGNIFPVTELLMLSYFFMRSPSALMPHKRENEP